MTPALCAPMLGSRRSTSLWLSVMLSLYHDLLPSPKTAEEVINKELFLSRARRAGVNRIGFLRHGKTSPAPPGGTDFDRRLTDEGRQQADEAGRSFGKFLAPFYPKVLASPAPRTMETAKIFLSASGANSTTTIHPVQGLYDGTMQPEGSVLFRKIGYAPLNDYVNNHNEQDRITSRKVLGDYAHLVAGNILDALDEHGEKDAGKALWVVGHAIYLPAAALGIASLADCSDESMETILSTSTREAEGYMIHLEEAHATYLERGIRHFPPSISELRSCVS